MFIYKTEKELAEMTPEQRDAYAKEKRDFEAAEQKKAIDAAVEKSKKELEEAQAKEKEALTKKIDELSLEIEAVKTKGDAEKVNELVKELKEKKEQLKSIAKGGNGEVELKALVTRASIATNQRSLFPLPDIGQLGVRERSLYNVLPKIQIGDGNHKGTIVYRDWDEATIVRAAAVRAEGAAFPESTAAFKDYSLPLRKIGDTLPVTEEFFEDEAQSAGELEMFLDTNVNTEIDDQLINGDGTGENLTGLLASVPAYTAVAEGLTDANIYDLVKRVRTSITKTRGSKYRPDIVVMNADTMDKLHLKKDDNKNYIFPPDLQNVGSITIVEDNNMPDNQLVVGDRRFARIYEKGGITISKGYVGAQFAEDEMTLKARKRMLLLIREVDKTGFRKVTDITAALTTLATAPA